MGKEQPTADYGVFPRVAARSGTNQLKMADFDSFSCRCKNWNISAPTGWNYTKF